LKVGDEAWVGRGLWEETEALEAVGRLAAAFGHLSPGGGWLKVWDGGVLGRGMCGVGFR